VVDWKEETASDLEDATRRLDELTHSVSGEPSEGQLRSVWLAYLDVEKSIAFIKAELSEENPGRFIGLKAYLVPDERQALRFGLNYLKKGSENFALGDLEEALKGLRESRNYLRALLREKRKLRRNSRAHGGSTSPSPPSSSGVS
jgi:hypothetical protein